MQGLRKPMLLPPRPKTGNSGCRIFHQLIFGAFDTKTKHLYIYFNIYLNIKTMPTIASQPSLRNTQAVGAILLHQFARERFLEAGINENLIQEAENQEHIDRLTASLLEDDIDNDSMSQHQDSTDNNFPSFGDQSQHVNNLSSNPTKLNNTKNSTIINDSTVDQNSTGQYQDGSNNDISETGEQYLSVADSSTRSHENTVWHSINANNSVPPNLDRLQSHPLMSTYGRELRKLADEFEKSRFRRSVKEKAEEVNLKDITREAFVGLLEEVFKGGITRERIVSLFFFCTDVALRAASFAQELVVRLLGWSFSYIIYTVCKRVHEFGGWNNILFKQLPLMLFNGCAILGFLVLAVYLHKTLRASS